MTNSLSFRIQRHRLGFLNSPFHRQYDVFEEGHSAAYATVMAGNIDGRAFALTIDLLGDDGKAVATYTRQPNDNLRLPGIGICEVLRAKDDPMKPLSLCCISTVAPDDLPAAEISYSVVMNLRHEARTQIVMVQPRLPLAEVRNAWRNDEVKAGILAAFDLSEGLDQNLNTLGLLWSTILVVRRDLDR